MYLYNTICDVCGFEYKAHELRKRWDGFMVCSADWEPRHPLDFYRTRNDVHKLPWTRPDNQTETTWTPTVVGVSGTYDSAATYVIDENNVITYQIQLTPTIGEVTGVSSTLTLPLGTVSVDRGGTVRTSLGRFLGALTNTTEINVPDFTVNASPLEVLLISGSYVKA